MTNNEFKALWKRYLNSEGRERERLFNKLAPVIDKTIDRALAGRGATKGNYLDDLKQEILIKLLRNFTLEKIEKPGNLIGYIATAARNRANDYTNMSSNYNKRLDGFNTLQQSGLHPYNNILNNRDLPGSELIIKETRIDPGHEDDGLPVYGPRKNNRFDG